MNIHGDDLRCRVVRVEDSRVLSQAGVLTFRSTNSTVTRGNEDGNASESQLHDSERKSVDVLIWQRVGLLTLDTADPYSTLAVGFHPSHTTPKSHWSVQRCRTSTSQCIRIPRRGSWGHNSGHHHTLRRHSIGNTTVQKCQCGTLQQEKEN